MSKTRSYFELLDELKEPGCAICAFVIKDGRRYLAHVLYESVLDVPTRLHLMDSYGFCSWHAWQLAELPAVYSPNTAFSIFASDLLRKFNVIGRAITETPRKRSPWRSFFHKGSRPLAAQIKGPDCPACKQAAQSEAYRLKDLADSIAEEEFLKAYQASQGVCVPHFLLIEKNHAEHPNFHLLRKLQLGKSESLRETLEQFTSKQDYRLHHQITSREMNAWRVAMEFLTGKPGVFNNEMAHDVARNSGGNARSAGDARGVSYQSDAVEFDELIANIKSAKEVTCYLQRPLPSSLFNALRDMAASKSRPTVDVVVEHLTDPAHLRELYAAGFGLFYGLGLPNRSAFFFGSDRGFLLEEEPRTAAFAVRALRHPENVYFRLLWCRFGHALLLSGRVEETDPGRRLFRLTTPAGKEVWCRLTHKKIPDAGSTTTVFAWEKWHSRILEVLDVAEDSRRDDSLR